MLPEISNDELRPEHVPSHGAPWYPTIVDFALTFDGYEWIGQGLPDFAKGKFARWNRDGSLPRELGDLRACLFWAQRWVRHSYTEEPSAEDLAYAHDLIEAIRDAVEARGETKPWQIDVCKLTARVDGIGNSDRVRAPCVGCGLHRLVQDVQDRGRSATSTRALLGRVSDSRGSARSVQRLV